MDFTNTHQQPFRSLIAAFRRALQSELLKLWLDGRSSAEYELSSSLQSELRTTRELDFDLSVLEFIDPLLTALREKSDRKWLREAGRPKALAHDLSSLSQPTHGISTIVIDRVDESWDGSHNAVVFLIALMHAALEVSTQVSWARVLIFLRENVMERVRSQDTEFARLETCVVGLEWTKKQLQELVERRLNLPFNTRLAVDGTTWDSFFENGDQARSTIFDFCQQRPRDVLTFCTFAIETALSGGHQKIMIQDIQDARKRFSDTRLKDLGDEYSENYPQIQLVLSRFYGLGKRYTLTGLEAFIQKLLVDKAVKSACDRWIYDFAAPERLARLLYDIGFFGFVSSGDTTFRSVGAKSTVPPSVTSATEVVIHPCYVPALDLQDVLVTSLDKSTTFSRPGLLSELPETLGILDYQVRLTELEKRLRDLPQGAETFAEFEDIVGNILKLCFYRWLHNVKPHERDIEGCVVRDWIAANRAPDGFWEMVRTRYNATQVVWECKNSDKLQAEFFQQISYYLTRETGRFGIIAFRGEIQPHYYSHVKRIANDKDGMVLMLGQRDLLVFIRQARNGKLKEDHIQDRYDATIRGIS
jgi:cell division protein FtsL